MSSSTSSLPLPFKPIGFIHSNYTSVAGVPIQPTADPSSKGYLELLPELVPGLQDLTGFDRVWLVTWLHLAPAPKLSVVPFLDTQAHGIFATRSPCRPNPIGLASVKLVGVEGNIVRFTGCDLVDGTPVIDMKPYVPGFDSFPDAASGWFSGKEVQGKAADDRFNKP